MQVKGSAISYRRQQLGVAPLQGLFARCCRPLCTPETLGAYRFGKRLMALDGTMQDVADTQANAADFSRPSNHSRYGPFPQLRLLPPIEYRIADARLGEPEQIYRLAPTWLNPRTAPALDLIDCYHERWEVEVVLDEIKTHQRLQQPVLRSRTPEGVRKASLCAVTSPLCGACAHASRRLSGWRGPRSPQFYRCDLCPV